MLSIIMSILSPVKRTRSTWKSSEPQFKDSEPGGGPKALGTTSLLTHPVKIS